MAASVLAQSPSDVEPLSGATTPLEHPPPVAITTSELLFSELWNLCTGRYATTAWHESDDD